MRVVRQSEIHTSCLRTVFAAKDAWELAQIEPYLKWDNTEICANALRIVGVFPKIAAQSSSSYSKKCSTFTCEASTNHHSILSFQQSYTVNVMSLACTSRIQDYGKVSILLNITVTSTGFNRGKTMNIPHKRMTQDSQRTGQMKLPFPTRTTSTRMGFQVTV